MSAICDICNTKVSNKYNLTKHKQTESCQKVRREKEYNNNIFNSNNKIKDLENKIEQLKTENNEKDKIIINLKELSKNLKEKSEEYRKIIEKAATKSTKIVNNNNNNNNKNTYNHNNYLNYISQEPLKFSELQQKISKLVTAKTIMFDNDDFNDHITQSMLRDENGKDKVLCTDINRKNFTYKDEISGQMVSDPELERLREQLIKGSNNKSLKKDLLNKLIKKYEGTSVDPYNKFYEYLQNIQFGTPFVEHVAKKTYVKTKPNSAEHDNEPTCRILCDERSINEGSSTRILYDESKSINDIDIEDIDNFEDIDKLYNQMKDEFID